MLMYNLELLTIPQHPPQSRSLYICLIFFVFSLYSTPTHTRACIRKKHILNTENTTKCKHIFIPLPHVHKISVSLYVSIFILQIMFPRSSSLAVHIQPEQFIIRLFPNKAIQLSFISRYCSLLAFHVSTKPLISRSCLDRAVDQPFMSRQSRLLAIHVSTEQLISRSYLDRAVDQPFTSRQSI